MLLPGSAAAVIEALTGWPDMRQPPRLRVTGALGARVRALASLARRAVRRGRLAQILQGMPAGSVYLNVGHAHLGALAAARAGGLRSVVMVHDTIPLDLPQFASRPAGFRRRLEQVARQADRVICPSAAAAADVARWCAALGRVPAITVAPLGVPRPRPGAIPAQFGMYRDAFVTVGTVEPRKNHGLLLDVWDRLSATMDRPPRLLILGSAGWRNREVLDRIARLPDEGPVRFLPGLADATVAALVAEARALLMPSLAEGFGLPVAEAAALGTPVVCAPLPVYREILGDYPVYADPTDMYCWERTIRTLAEQPIWHPKKADEVPLPTWEDHFNLALNVV